MIANLFGKLESAMLDFSYVSYMLPNVSRELKIRELPNLWILAKIKFSQIIVNLQHS